MGPRQGNDVIYAQHQNREGCVLCCCCCSCCGYGFLTSACAVHSIQNHHYHHHPPSLFTKTISQFQALTNKICTNLFHCLAKCVDLLSHGDLSIVALIQLFPLFRNVNAYWNTPQINTLTQQLIKRNCFAKNISEWT